MKYSQIEKLFGISSQSIYFWKNLRKKKDIKQKIKLNFFQALEDLSERKVEEILDRKEYNNLTNIEIQNLLSIAKDTFYRYKKDKKKRNLIELIKKMNETELEFYFKYKSNNIDNKS